MDVVCDRCQTEYDFDDALVSERGTTVKCTNCGHQFKIYKPSSAAQSAPWVLRRADGTTVSFDSLAVLQKWIAEGRVTRTDQLSRSGSDWKPLGSIAELESFFTNAAQRSRAGGGTREYAHSGPPPGPSATEVVPPTAARGGTLRSGGSAGSAPPGGGSVPPPRATATTQPGTGTGPTGGPSTGSASTAFAATMARDDGRPADPSYSMGSAAAPTRNERFALGNVEPSATESWSGQVPAASIPPAATPPLPPPAPFGPAAPAAAPPFAHTNAASPDELAPSNTYAYSDDDLRLPRSGGGLGTVVLLVLGVLGLGGAVGLAVWRFGLLNGNARSTSVGISGAPAAPDRVSATLERAEQTARAANRATYEEARDQLTALLTSDPDDARVHALRGSMLALSAEQDRQRAEDLEARAALPGSDAATLRAQAGVIREQVATTLGRARADVTAAESGAVRVTAPPQRWTLEVALGETSRVLGDMSSSRHHVDAARALSNGPQLGLLAALLERDANQTDAAIDHLRALASDPIVGTRAHLALGRLFAQRGDPAGAQAEAEAVLRAVPQHEDAVALVQAVTLHQPPVLAAGTVPMPPPTTVAAQPPAPVAADAGPHPVVAANGAESPAGGAPSGVGGVHGYEALVDQGERLREHGARERARQSFLAAIDARSDGSEAITGLGEIELDGGSASAAIQHFRRALEINPRYSDALIGLAEAYGRTGQLQESLHAYENYLSVNPGGSRAGEARSRIESIRARMGTGTAPAPSGSDPAPPAPTPPAPPAPSTGAGSGTGSTGGAPPAPSEGSGGATAPPLPSGT